MRWEPAITTVAAVAVLVASAVFAGGPLASEASADAADGNEAPLADAGLDRTVTENTTVYLDATESRDPDGTVDAYRWRIERPDGGYTTPSCERCGRTEFVPRESGLYNATVVVTDDDGATSSDTLRVRVNESDGPTLSVTGPDEAVAGRLAGYSASVSAGNMDLAAVVWQLNDHRLNRTTLTGESAVLDHGHVFESTGEYTLRVQVVDRLGRERTASKNVTVVSPTSPSGGGSAGVGDGGGGAGGGGGSAGGSGSGTGDCYYPPESVFSCEADSVTGINGGNGSVIVTDSDRDGNVTVNGETFSVREGDSVSINQSTWEEHYQIETNSSLYEGSNENQVYYQPGIEQGPNDGDESMVGDWEVPRTSTPVIDIGDGLSGGGTGPWTGTVGQSDRNTESASNLPEGAPERIQEQIDRARGDESD